MSVEITTLAVWTVTFDVVTDSGTVCAWQESLQVVADNAGDAIVQALNYGAVNVEGGHYAVTGAVIRRSDPLNGDVPADVIADSVVGLVDLQA